VGNGMSIKRSQRPFVCNASVLGVHVTFKTLILGGSCCTMMTAVAIWHCWKPWCMHVQCLVLGHML
jgi:hypothetical protein